MKKLLLLLLLSVGLIFVSCEKDEILKPPTSTGPVPEYATIRLEFSDFPKAGDVFTITDCCLGDLNGNYLSENIADQIADQIIEDYPIFDWELDTSFVRIHKGEEILAHIRVVISRNGVSVDEVDQIFNFVLVTKPEINKIAIDLSPDD